MVAHTCHLNTQKVEVRGLGFKAYLAEFKANLNYIKSYLNNQTNKNRKEE